MSGSITLDFEKHFSQIAGETVNVEFAGYGLFVWGSEAATDKIKQSDPDFLRWYSDSCKGWCAFLESTI